MQTACRLLIILTMIMGVAKGQPSDETVQQPSDSPQVEILVLTLRNCPLVIINPEFVEKDNGKWWGAHYQVKNVGSKPIRSFTTLMLTSSGVGGSLGHFVPNALFLPSQTLDSDSDADVRSTPKPDAVPGRKRELKAFVVIMIGKVVFEDGTVLDNEERFNKLQAYLSKMDDAKR